MGLLSEFSGAARSAVANWAASKNTMVVTEPGPISYENGVLPAVATIHTFGREVTLDFDAILGRSPEALYREQPNLRAVVSFLARNVAQLGLHVFDRVDDNDRQRISSGPVYQLLRSPNERLTQYELINNLMAELALNDMAYWWVFEDVTRPSGWTIQPLSVAALSRVHDSSGSVSGYRWSRSRNPNAVIPAEQVLTFHGYNPASETTGLSPVVALRTILAEQLAAVAYRQQRWDRGARVGTYLSRPANAPQWSADAQQRFAAEWRDKWGKNGPDAGGEPLLQDGMELKRIGFSAKEDDYIEASKLTLTTVASVYHVNPVMVGLLDNANYSNVREFRKMLYGDTLGPWLAMLEARLTTFLLPMIGASPDAYVEFNVAAKLQGSFEEQASVMSTMVGRPVMTANEGRARFNLPRIEADDADQLITPLNVTVGGQPSPQTPVEPPIGEGEASAPLTWRRPGTAKTLAPRRAKSRPSDLEQGALEKVLGKFFARQGRSVLAAIGAKKSAPEPGDPSGVTDSWWDGKRWDTELAADLYEHAMKVSTRLGSGVFKGYQPKQTEAYLTKLAEIRARAINETTHDQLVEVLDREDDDEEEDAPTPAGVFETAQGSRGKQIAVTVLTSVAGFASVEAGKQASGGHGGTKTWVVTSATPRPEHAAMDGETVSLDDEFSNGAQWPGDPVLGADGVAGCQCDVTIEWDDQ